ncbi:MAG: GntR family transcriptional regulator [Spirochaetaceae bacterium]|jgi:DNA-binding LacI/PurR family transcriptional regulator|nr:GntR family transcriptional regulator [Spirochaetaceae bacterium]
MYGVTNLKSTGRKTKTHPYYKLIYDYLSEEISSGRLKLGDKLPSEKELCATFGVSRITSKKALELLAREGLIFRLPGKGSFVGESVERKAVTLKNISASRVIGLVISDFNDAFGTQLLYAIEETSTALGYHLILKRSQESAAAEERALQHLTAEDVAGILILPVHGDYYNAEILKQIVSKRPLVFVDRKMKGLPVPSVSTDNVVSAQEGVEHLLRLGHRNIAFYSGPMEHISTVEDRWSGFNKAFNDSGIILEPAFCCTNITGDSDTGAIIEHLSKYPQITAAFVTEFSLYLMVKQAVETLGRRIPEDFSIVTLDAPTYMQDSLTYLRQNEYEIGKRAVEVLHSIITGSNPASIGDVQIPAQLKPGGSTGAWNPENVTA